MRRRLGGGRERVRLAALHHAVAGAGGRQGAIHSSDCATDASQTVLELMAEVAQMQLRAAALEAENAELRLRLVECDKARAALQEQVGPGNTGHESTI